VGAGRGVVPGPPGWGLGVWLNNLPPPKHLLLRNLRRKKRNIEEAKTHAGLCSTSKEEEEEEVSVHSDFWLTLYLIFKSQEILQSCFLSGYKMLQTKPRLITKIYINRE
jgi:hypothetical protein